MNNQTQSENTAIKPAKKAETSPLRCLTGALIAGALTTGLYSLTMSIAESFAAKPIHSDNEIVVRLSIAIRTLVVGVSTMATGIFGLVAVALVALAIQIFVQQLTQKQTPPSDVN
jgi:hypothetical protein